MLPICASPVSPALTVIDGSLATTLRFTDQSGVENPRAGSVRGTITGVKRTPVTPSAALTNRLLALAVLPVIVATVTGLIVLWPDAGQRARTLPPEELASQAQLIDGVVTADEALPCEDQPDSVGGCRVVTVRIDGGPEKGATTELQLFDGAGQPKVTVGDKVIIGRVADTTGVSYYFSDFQRRVPMALLAIVFVVVVAAVGRLRGLTAIVGVAATFAILVWFVIPALLDGRDPLAVAIVGSSAAMFAVLYLSHGISAKTTAALLGTVASLALTGVLASVFVRSARLFNLGGDEAALLQLTAAQVNLQGLLLGGIIIGSLGVLNDVTVTQSSTVWALARVNPGASCRSLYRSGMRVGRDHIASTVDTLVLAYAGASMPLLLLFTLARRPGLEVVTGSLVAEEVVRTMVGGIGLVASVPITTGLAALVVSRSRSKGSGGASSLESEAGTSAKAAPEQELDALLGDLDDPHLGHSH